MSDIDFGAAERDGWGTPWPIRYADIAPYYDKVEQLIGVCGGDDSSDVLPGSKYYMPAPAPRCGEVFIRKSAESIGIPVVAIRRANLTRDHRGFPACHYCGNYEFNQMHEVDNLFVVDGSAFTNASEKNPTLSILALSWRATDYLAEEMRQGNL